MDRTMRARLIRRVRDNARRLGFPYSLWTFRLHYLEWKAGTKDDPLWSPAWHFLAK